MANFVNPFKGLSTNKHKEEVRALAEESLGKLEGNLWEKAIAGAFLTVYERHYVERATHSFKRAFKLSDIQIRQAIEAFHHLK